MLIKKRCRALIVNGSEGSYNWSKVSVSFETSINVISVHDPNKGRGRLTELII
jgi:hypothetical protein